MPAALMHTFNKIIQDLNVFGTLFMLLTETVLMHAFNKIIQHHHISQKGITFLRENVSFRIKWGFEKPELLRKVIFLHVIQYIVNHISSNVII